MNESNDTSETLEYLHKFEIFQFYYYPILVPLGIIGNCLSIYVIVGTKLKKLSSSCYLVALLISDSIFLGIIFIVWLQMIDIDWFNRPFFCEILTYMGGVCSCLSVWLVVAFSIERFVAVMYPLKSKLICTVAQARMIIAILVITTLVTYIPQLMIADAILNEERNVVECSAKRGWYKAAHIFNIFDTIMTYVVPVIVIAVLNTCITKAIWKFSNLRWKMTNSHQLELISNKDKPSKKKNKGSYNLTIMLLMVSTVCLAMNFPSYITRIITYLLEAELVTMDNDAVIAMQQCSLILFNTNFGINFVLYCISGQNFRKSVVAIFCRRKNFRGEMSPLTDIRTQSTSTNSSYKKRRITMRSNEMECML